MTMKKFVYFASWFKPDEDFIEFCKSIDLEDTFEYVMKNRCKISDPIIESFMFDSRVVQYVEDHSFIKNNIPHMYGAKSCEYKIGFCGYAYILNVDIDKMWTIDNYSEPPKIKYATTPRIVYVLQKISKYNYMYEYVTDSYDEYIKFKSEIEQIN